MIIIYEQISSFLWKCGKLELNTKCHVEMEETAESKDF